MAFAGIHIGYYEDAPLGSSSDYVTLGRLISSFEDTTVSTIETTTIPKNCTNIVVTTSVDAFVEIDTGTPDAASGRRQFVKAAQPYRFVVPVATAAQYSIGYLAA